MRPIAAGRLLQAILSLGAVLWLAAILLAPRLLASPSRLLSLSSAAVYAIGARVCHQRPDRCFLVDGRPMPVCARCAGLYAGAALAAPLALVAAAAMASRRARMVAVLAALPTLATWSIEFAGLAHPTNAVRALSALPLGAMAGWLVLGTLRGRQGRMT